MLVTISIFKNSEEGRTENETRQKEKAKCHVTVSKNPQNSLFFPQLAFQLV